MANFYTDHPEIKFNIESSPLMNRIVELRENGFANEEKSDYAPADYADAIDNYNKVCELAGDIVSNVIAPNAEAVDAEGPIAKTAASATQARLTKTWKLP